MMWSIGVIVALGACIVAPCRAQSWQADGHANYSRTTQSHQNSWGGGASLQATWGAQQQPVQLGTSAGVDYEEQENGGPKQFNVSYEMTVQPGGNLTLTPYVGGSVSANWLSGDGAPSGAKLGLQYIVGAQLKPERQGPLAIKLELRPGYVQTQEHTVSGRLGVAFSM